LDFLKIARLTIPVMMGYIPLGMAFGLMSVKLGIAWHYVLLMSVFIYAGAGQFLAATLIAANASFLTIFTAVFLLNLRHFFYGLAMISDFEALKGIAKKYAIFALTDETFALLKTIDTSKQDRAKTFTIVSFLNQTYWVMGTIIGILLGENLFFDTRGIEFCLTALFIVLCVELYKQNRGIKPLLLSSTIGIFGIFAFPKEHMLILTLLLCVFSLAIFKKRIENER
jgi:4-azaleucine resistance transporter AzlC